MAGLTPLKLAIEKWMFSLMVIKIALKIPLTWMLLKASCLKGFFNLLKIKGLSSPPTAMLYLKNVHLHQSGFLSA